MVEREDVIERLCEVADFLTERECKKNNIEMFIDQGDHTIFTDQAQVIFDGYYDYFESSVEDKLLREEKRNEKQNQKSN